MDNADKSKYNVSKETVVSSKGCDVDHPLFGTTTRFGWAVMRNSDEYSFTISYCKTK